MQYSDMELELAGSLIKDGEKRTGSYQVRVLRSPAGEMTAEQATPVEYDDKQLQFSLDQLEQRDLDGDLDRLIALGRTLAGILLPTGGADGRTGVRELFARSLADLDRDRGLRLRLRLPHELSVIPWEYMFVERAGGVGADGFLGLDPRIAIVRHESLTAAANPPLLTGDIKVVTAIAALEDLAPLDLDREQRVLNEGLKGLDLVVQPCTAATLDKLQPLLAGAGVFHFAGHGDFAKQIGPRPGTYTGTGLLAFQDQRVDAEQLAVNLRGHGIRLAVLAACQTARRDGFTVWSGIAPALIRSEIPAVVAHQYAIKDSTAIAFSQQFYQALAAGLPIERAVTAGRIGAYNQDKTGRDWGVPVLYLSAADGDLFEGAADTTARERARISAEADVNLRIGDVQAGAVVTGAELVSMLTGHLAVNVAVPGTVLGELIGVDGGDLKRGSVMVDMDMGIVGPGGRIVGAKVGQIGGRPVLREEQNDAVKAPDVPPWEPRPPVMGEPADGDAVETFLNATLNNGDEPLQIAKTYQLAVHFGERSTAQAAQVFVPFPKDDNAADLEVRIVSSDFEVPPLPQMLRVKRDGKSIGRALFEVTPVRKDPTDQNESQFWMLSVLVTVKGNHLQRLDLTYDLEDGATEADSKSYTRGGLTGATVLRERKATLYFRPTDWGYELIAPQSPKPQPHKILVTPLELDKFIASVRSALLHSVRLESVAFGMEMSEEDNRTLLSELALAGFRLFQLLFAGDNATDDLLAVGDWLCASIAKKDDATLQVVSDGFPVPWPLLYPAERWDPADISWDNFIGMRCVVEQLPLTNPTPESPELTIESVPDLTVRALFNDAIDEKIPTKPMAEQRRYWADAGVALRVGTSAGDLIDSALAKTANDKILYLYCHATSPSKDPEASKLIFGDSAISLQQLRDSAPRRDKLPGHPLVFINACESADLSPQFYGGFVPYFLGKGARGVIGTECKVPGLFAGEWAKAFFDELFTGKPLGDAVLHLRRRFLVEHNNPLGLLYGVHCDTDTIVAPALSKPAAL